MPHDVRNIRVTLVSGDGVRRQSTISARQLVDFVASGVKVVHKSTGFVFNMEEALRSFNLLSAQHETGRFEIRVTLQDGHTFLDVLKGENSLTVLRNRATKLGIKEVLTLKENSTKSTGTVQALIEKIELHNEGHAGTDPRISGIKGYAELLDGHRINFILTESNLTILRNRSEQLEIKNIVIINPSVPDTTDTVQQIIQNIEEHLLTHDENGGDNGGKEPGVTNDFFNRLIVGIIGAGVLIGLTNRGDKK